VIRPRRNQSGTQSGSLALLRVAARAVLLFEQVWPAVWPALGVAGAFAAAALLGLVAMLPPVPHIVFLVAVAATVTALLVRGLRRIAIPAAAAADRRLERASGLLHRPLAALADRPAGGTADELLWRAHVARVRARVGRLRVGVPRPGLAALDRRALRGLLLVALVAGLFVAGIDAPARLAAAITPHLAPGALPPVLQIEAWVTPPATTGLPPTALPLAAMEDTAIEVPAGSRLVVSLSGGAGGVPRFRVGDAEQPFRDLGGGSFQAATELAASNVVAVRRDGAQLARWRLAVLVDPAPLVMWSAPPGAASRGRRDQAATVRLPWRASHPYGVTALQARLTLRQRPAAAPVILDIPLPGASPKAAAGVRSVDLAAHPWAGLPVAATLVGHDAAGLAGHSDEAMFTLPERAFQHPGAQAIVSARKLLALDPGNHAPPLAVLDRLAQDDATWRDDLAGFLNLRLIMAQLARDPGEAAADAVQPSLWELALHLEEGAPARTAAALARERAALRKLLDAQRHGDKVDRAEIDKRAQTLQQALRNHLSALAQQARRDPANNPPPTAGQEAQRTLQQLRDAARRGDMDSARDRQAELDKMLQALQDQGSDGATQAQRQRAQARRAGRQQGQEHMSVLQDLVQREAGLLDHATSRSAPADPLRDLYGVPSETPGGGPSQQDNAQAGQQRGDDRRVQQALRLALGELMQQFGDLTGKVPPNLGNADIAMRQAIGALTQGQDALAATAAQQAITALQQGGKGMSQTLARQFGRGPSSGDGQDGDQGQGGDGQADGQGNGQGTDPGGVQPGDGPALGEGNGSDSQGQFGESQPGQQTDPFGRRLPGGLAGSDGGETRVPEQMEQARTRAIQEELRRRGSDRTRAQTELDYIDRLLQPY